MKIRLLAFSILTCIASQAQKLEGKMKINGTSLYFHTLGSGEPLLIFHGGPGMNQSYFMPHFDKLSKKYKLIFYDQRASGKSAIPATDSISLKFFVDDIEAIRKELGVEKLSLLGHSWGVVPVINYGIQYPDKVKKMILCNPIPLSQEFDTEMLENQKRKSSYKDSTDRSIIMGSRDFKSGNPEAYKRLMLLSFRNSFYNSVNYSKLQIEIPSNYLAASKALLSGLGKDLAQYNYYNAIKSFSFPVLILHGMSDAIPVAASRKTETSIPHAQLVQFKKSGHFIFIEEPSRFVGVVGSFLGK